MNILRPALLPDETAHSYLGRIMRLNGWSDPKEALREIGVWSTDKNGSTPKPVPVDALARVAGLELTQFVRHHTLLGHKRAFAAELDRPTLVHGSPEAREVLRVTGLYTAREGSYFCERCAAEDVAFHGVSYWRRAHQLPGTCWCCKHNWPLSFNRDDNAMHNPPTAFLGKCSTLDGEWVNGLRQNPWISRFLSIIADLVDGISPLSETGVARMLSDRAASQGWHTGAGAAKLPHIVSLLVQRFDTVWLETVIPDVAANRSLGPCGTSIDRALKGGRRHRVNASTYVGLATVLFDTTSEAMAALASAGAPGREEGTRLEGWSPAEDELRQAYVDAKGDLVAAAAAMGVGRERLRRRLQRSGLPGLGGYNQGGIRAVAHAFLVEGAPLISACEKGGLSLSEFEHFLRSVATPLRSAMASMEARPQRAPRSRGNRRRFNEAIPPQRGAAHGIEISALNGAVLVV